MKSENIMEEKIDKGNTKIKKKIFPDTEEALDQFSADINEANAISSAKSVKNAKNQ
ncbi:hypothetical protein P22_2312 [Propionispora sp. 2/2-37]|uniref:hypothetical protein n=1 Tax=Propionispora sp. 2/2-37 TaxID=1677858 RepID=UPI0006BF3531|nr:hypothetical protein [Propionispora sp. 2/2-37]CUH96223.1 hypothetical protein P22_2312 [Propionispora sp. 2/2-37]